MSRIMQEHIVWTASITPFDEQGQQPDLLSLKQLLIRQEQARNGILLFGSTGEGLSLSLAERCEILTLVAGLKLKSSIMVGVPSHNLKEAVEWLSICRDFPLAGYLMTTPIYSKPGIAGQTAWFEELFRHANHKVMLYNIPHRSGIKLFPETVKNLAQHERLWAIKDSCSIESFVDFKMAAPDIKIFCGDDYMMPAMASEGASGLVSVASNAWPDATKRYVQQCLLNQKLSSTIWWKAGRALFTASNPIPIKALLKDQGLIAHDTVRLPLSQKDLPSRDLLNDLHDTMLHWQDDYVL